MLGFSIVQWVKRKIAQLLKKEPNLTSDQVKQQLTSACEDRGLPPYTQSNGYLDASNLISYEEEVFKNIMKNPIIGVFVSTGIIRRLNRQQRNFKSYSRIDSLAKGSKKLKISLYFFSIYDVDFKKSTVRGTYFNQHKSIWAKKNFPLPDILYDRGGASYLKPHKIKSKTIRKKFSELGIKSVNSKHYFSKWRTYEVLKEVPELQPHLPQTKLCEDLSDLKTFMNGKDKIYIKGIYGGRGRQVICLKKTEDGSYELNYFIDKLVSRKEQSLEDVYNFLSSFFKTEFIIQQAISLMVINNSLVDFRAEVQRNKSGDLEVVGVPVRLGLEQSPITIHSEAYPFEEFFRKFFNYSEDEIIQKKKSVDNFLKKVYESVEAYFGPFGEIGIDFGMDDQGGLWFIECNAKSAKVSLCKAYDEETVEKVFLNPLEYAKFIYNNKP